MRISRVQVDGLFGVFNHDVPLSHRDRVTIIHGPNGYGKTILLKLVDGIFNRRNAVLRSVPFGRLLIQFDDGKSTLTVTKTPNGKSGERAVMAYRVRGGSTKEATLPQLTDARTVQMADYVEHFVPGLERVTARAWRYAHSGEVLGLEEVLDRFGDLIDPSLVRSLGAGGHPDWLEQIRRQVHVRLIETQRLQRPLPVTKRTRETDGGAGLTVAAYAEDLAKLIQAKLAESATVSQSLDRSFPARLVSQRAPGDLTDERLREELVALEHRRADLREAGLLDTEMASDFQVPRDIDAATKSILAVYVDDTKTKLGIFADLAARTDLLKRIVNERFLYKEIVVSKENGFVFRTPDGKTLSPRHLSSGEQHELVLLYELLFKVESPALILIDEPELSLHVAWQQAFLRDLQEVARLGDFDVLLATHSPQIISDRWDLTVELEGPAEADARHT